MFTALDAPSGMLDQHERNFVAKVREHGWLDTQVVPDGGNPGFSYTTGFWLKFGQPELIVFALRPKIAHDTFWHIYRELEAGKRFPVGEPTDQVFVNTKCYFLPVSPDHYASRLTWTRWFYGSKAKVECRQLVHPDMHGNFPWSPGISEHELRAQPDLTAGNWSGLRSQQ